MATSNKTQPVVNLSAELQSFASEFAKKVPDDVRRTMDRAGRDLGHWLNQNRPLDTGDTIPSFSLPDATGQVLSTATLLEKGPLAIAFYRGHWCPYCNLALKALQRSLDDIQNAGGNLVAISPQVPDQSMTTAEKNDLAFPVLSDIGNAVASQFGLVFELPEEIRPIYDEFGIDLRAANGDGSFQLPVPATYVIGTDGKIVFAHVNADYRTRAEPASVIEAFKNLRR